MKLKKIASLMLAGVMAVSMLAGCQTGSNGNGEEPEVPAVPSTSDAASSLHDNMIGTARRKSSPVANADLDAALKKAVDTYFQNGDFQNVANVATVVAVDNGKIYEALVDAMGAKKSIANDLTDTVDKVTTAVKLYAVEASTSDAYALEMVADEIEGSIANLKLKSNKASTNQQYDYAYTISASIVTKPISSSIVTGAATGVKYIAVAVTQTPTKAV